MCFLREYSQESAMPTLKEAEPYHKKGWILGVGLDSDEHHNPPLKFMLVFAKARAQGYYLTMHCDLHQVDSVDHIKQALEIITVDRLDHGLNIVENADLMTFLTDQKIGITACPMAYFYTRKVMEQEAINKLFNSGALISFNTDDPAYKGSNYINDVYYKFAQKCDWSEKELIRIAQNSFKTSWTVSRRKKAILRK